MTTAPKTILITGSSSGIGLSLVQKWLTRGHSVIGVSRSPSPYQHASYTHHQCDLSIPLQVEAFSNTLESLDIDLFCHSAMYSPKHRPFLSVPVEDMEKAYRVGVIAPLILIKKLYLSKKNKLTRVILFNSLVIQQGSSGQLPYLCAKKALHGLHMGLTHELENRSIKISSLLLGPVETEGLLKNLSKERQKRLLSVMKDKRFITTEEVIDTIDTIMTSENSGETYQLGELE